jgi:hypothetical protein
MLHAKEFLDFDPLQVDGVFELFVIVVAASKSVAMAFGFSCQSRM